MGCASSTATAKDEVVHSTSTPKALHESREKSITAGTEAMTNHVHLDSNVLSDASFTTNETKAPTSKSAILGGSLHVRYACMSRKGRDPENLSKPNQDAYSVHEGFYKDADFFGVYDGHGPEGQECSQFVRRRLPELVRCKLKENSQDLYNMSLHDAHVECNEELRSCSAINDLYSGTTCITLYVHGQDSGKLSICNLGDSRAIMGTPIASSTSLRAVPLSNDQTPKRADEAARCKRSGARILSFGEIDPSTKEDDDDVEDPPRVWSKKGNYPGVAFTRSIGDAVAEKLGVFAEPEQLTLKLSPHEVKIIVLATDGVFDVMSDQEVIDLCHRHYRQDPMQACRAVIEKSHREWLNNDDCCINEETANYDDMTMICIFIDSDQQIVGATADTPEKDNARLSAASEPAQPKQKRVRHKQKTLQNLEEMGIQQ